VKLKRVFQFLGLLMVALCVTVIVVVNGCATFGASASGDRAARMRRSPQWHDGGFANPQPMWNDYAGMVTAMRDSDDVAPKAPVPAVFSDGAALQTLPASGLRVTWFGHSSTLLEVDGVRLLTDPAFDPRASPFDWVGPQRWFAPPIALKDLPHVDAVVISHDHYDHLQHATIVQMKEWETLFIVPLGVGAHLESWGVPASRIRELDWWEETKVGSVDVTLPPSRHASGRQLFDQNATLWGSYVFAGPQHRVFFSGDTGFFAGLKEIGDRKGPFDLTMIEVGQYHATWPDWHIGPEQAVRAHALLRGRVMLPVHWSLWTLAPHAWTEPADRVVVAAAHHNVALVLPKPGESVEPAVTAARSTPVAWWPSLPGSTAAQDPITATQNGDPAFRVGG
jgi:L-ascorbate metabolism protein UlaG (beta-lactamase superfamily)